MRIVIINKMDGIPLFSDRYLRDDTGAVLEFRSMFAAHQYLNLLEQQAADPDIPFIMEDYGIFMESQG